jgi:FtsP/CotA-like multicopper oxidase with cupredoxin domain
MKHIFLWVFAVIGIMTLTVSSASAKQVEYNLVINKEMVNITGKAMERITVNGGIPGPTLKFTDGDEAIIHVTNKMDKDTSVHWH